MKQFARCLLCVLLILLIISSSAYGEDSEFLSGDFWCKKLKDGTIEVGYYNGSASELEIPAKINGKKVTSLGDRVFASARYLEKITIPGNVKRIGTETFTGCVNLHTVELTKGLESIGESAFSGCSALKEIANDVITYERTKNV